MLNVINFKKIYDDAISSQPTKETMALEEDVKYATEMSGITACGHLVNVNADRPVDLVAAAKVFRACALSDQIYQLSGHAASISFLIYALHVPQILEGFLLNTRNKGGYFNILTQAVARSLGLDKLGEKNEELIQKVLDEMKNPSPSLYKNVLEVIISSSFNNPSLSPLFNDHRGHSDFASACYVVTKEAGLNLSDDIMVKMIKAANFPASFLKRGDQNPHRAEALRELKLKDSSTQTIAHSM